MKSRAGFQSLNEAPRSQTRGSSADSSGQVEDREATPEARIGFDGCEPPGAALTEVDRILGSSVLPVHHWARPGSDGRGVVPNWKTGLMWRTMGHGRIRE